MVHYATSNLTILNDSIRRSKMNKKKRQIKKEEKWWNDRYGHLCQHTKWDDKKRHCDTCKQKNGEPVLLGVDLSGKTPTLFCPFCLKQKGDY